MPKASKPGFYAVARGKNPGIYMDWDECEAQVNGYASAKYKKHATREAAEAWLKSNGVTSTTEHSSGTSRNEASTSRHPEAGAGTARDDSNIPQVVPEAPEGYHVFDVEGWDIVYCDGACSNNGKSTAIAGLGVWWGRGDKRNLSERCPGAQTNNRAELIAIARALETAPFSKVPLMIKTDSNYSINCLGKWMKGFLQRNWKTAAGAPVSNAEILRYISCLLDARARRSQKVRLQWVKGHAGEEGNEGADRLAVLGCMESAVADREWEALRKTLQDKIDEVEPRAKADVQNPPAPDPVFEIGEDELDGIFMTEEELARAANGDFD